MPDPELQLIGAAKAGDAELVQRIIGAFGKNQEALDYALGLAAVAGHLDVVRCLLAAGADVHTNWDQALRWSAQYGHLDVVACLLDAGADVHANSEDPLRWAADHGHVQVVSLLRERGASWQTVLDEMRAWEGLAQVAVVAVGDVTGLTVAELARHGVCPEALCALLERQGNADLAAILAATQMLEPLTPEARSELLGEMLAKHPQPERAHVGP